MSGFDDLVADGRALTGVRLGSLTTYKLGGPARFYVELLDRGDLPVIANALAEDPQPVLVVGRGSNLVISDQGWPGLAIRFGFAFTEIGIGPEPDCLVTAGAATTLPRLARETVNRGRGGLEFYVGIPGSVGGAVRTNAGGHGSETADWLVEAEIFDLQKRAYRRFYLRRRFLLQHPKLALSPMILKNLIRVLTLFFLPGKGSAHK